MKNKPTGKVYKIGYWHSSSEYTDLGYILCKRKSEAEKRCKELADGLCEVKVSKVNSIYDLANKKIIDFLLIKGELR